MQIDPIIINNARLVIMPFSISGNSSMDLPEGKVLSTAYNIKAQLLDIDVAMKKAILEALSLSKSVTVNQISKINISINVDLKI